MPLTNIANTFGGTEYVLSLPIILLILFAIGIVLIDLITPSEWKWINAATALAGIVFSAGGVVRIQFAQAQSEAYGRRLEWAFGHSMLVDHLSIFFYYIFLAGAVIGVLTSAGRMKNPNVHPGRACALILLTVVGMMGMAAGFDIVIIFVGLQLMNVSTYLLAVYFRKGHRAAEAGLKFFRRGSISTAILASGLSLLYGVTRSTNLQIISQRITNLPEDRWIMGNHLVVTLALGLAAIGLFSKIAAAPFHQWLLDTCEGSSASIAGFTCVAFQTAGWAMLLRVLLWGLYRLRAEYVPMLIFVSVSSMVGANVAALTQTRVTRLLAYSSIAHSGFIILGLVSLASVEYPAPAFFEGFQGILIYLLAYLFMNLGAFAIVESLPQPSLMDDRDRQGLEDIAGLFYRAPTLAVLMAIFLCSLAGIPLFAGFYGKYFILQSLFASGRYMLAALAIVCSIIALYYYGRLAQAMFVRNTRVFPVFTGISMRIALGIAGLFTLAIGIYPKPFIHAMEWSLRLS